MKKHQRNRYRTPTISLHDYTQKILSTGAPLTEYLDFIRTFRYALTNRTKVNTTCWLVIFLGRREHSNTSNPHDDWRLRMTIYETPTFYEWMVNKSETVTAIDEYEDKTTFEIQDLGEYLAKIPWYEIPSQIILNEHEAHKLLSDETVPIGRLLADAVSVLKGDAPVRAGW